MSRQPTDVDAILAAARAAAASPVPDVHQFIHVRGAPDGVHLYADGETFANVPALTSVEYRPSRGGLSVWGAGPMNALELAKLIRWADGQGIEVSA